MKTIKMDAMICGSNGWVNNGTKEFKRVSRWIKVRENYNPSKRNSLFDYVQDGYGYNPYNENYDPENNGGAFLTYFRFGGRNYATEQFLALGNPFYNPVTYSYTDDHDKTCFLSGVDGDNYYNPYYVEFDEYMEYVRVYEEV